MARDGVGVTKSDRIEHLMLAITIALVACGDNRPIEHLMLAITIALVACGDNRPIAVLLDAPPDAEVDRGCCVLYPDEDAIRACAQPNVPLCACSVLACEISEDTFLRVPLCNRPPECAMDAGVDAPNDGDSR